MFKLKSVDIYASEIADYLGLKLIGKDILIKSPSSIDKSAKNSISFIEDASKYETLNFDKLDETLFLVAALPEESPVIKCTHIFSENPKLDFIRVVNEFFTEPENYGVASSAKISPFANISKNVSIGENVVIGPDTIIGDNTEIRNNVVINGIVTIGRNCLIKDNATIGSMGYHFERDEYGYPIQFPNLGEILIGDDVLIGSNSTIEIASFNLTVIEEQVKVDDLVQIGFNSIIGKKSLITAGVIISRNVKIGEGCVIGPNSTIGENVSIEPNSIVGMGSVVLSNIERDSVYVGNPAHFIKTNL